jgi:hypothetical protein
LAFEASPLQLRHTFADEWLTQGGAETNLMQIAGPAGAVRGAARLDLTTVRRAADDVESYVRADGTKVWSLM